MKKQYVLLIAEPKRAVRRAVINADSAYKAKDQAQEIWPGTNILVLGEKEAA